MVGQQRQVSSKGRLGEWIQLDINKDNSKETDLKLFEELDCLQPVRTN